MRSQLQPSEEAALGLEEARSYLRRSMGYSDDEIRWLTNCFAAASVLKPICDGIRRVQEQQVNVQEMVDELFHGRAEPPPNVLREITTLAPWAGCVEVFGRDTGRPTRLFQVVLGSALGEAIQRNVQEPHLAWLVARVTALVCRIEVPTQTTMFLLEILANRRAPVAKREKVENRTGIIHTEISGNVATWRDRRVGNETDALAAHVVHYYRRWPAEKVEPILKRLSRVYRVAPDILAKAVSEIRLVRLTPGDIWITDDGEAMVVDEQGHLRSGLKSPDEE